MQKEGTKNAVKAPGKAEFRASNTMRPLAERPRHIRTRYSRQHEVLYLARMEKRREDVRSRYSTVVSVRTNILPVFAYIFTYYCITQGVRRTEGKLQGRWVWETQRNFARSPITFGVGTDCRVFVDLDGTEIEDDEYLSFVETNER